MLIGRFTGTDAKFKDLKGTTFEYNLEHQNLGSSESKN